MKINFLMKNSPKILPKDLRKCLNLEFCPENKQEVP